MKIWRRVLFFALLAGVFGLAVAVTIQYSHSDLAAHLGFIAIASLFGLQIWSAIFLKVEPDLARIGLLVVTVCVAALYFWAALHPD